MNNATHAEKSKPKAAEGVSRHAVLSFAAAHMGFTLRAIGKAMQLNHKTVQSHLVRSGWQCCTGCKCWKPETDYRQRRRNDYGEMSERFRVKMCRKCETARRANREYRSKMRIADKEKAVMRSADLLPSDWRRFLCMVEPTGGRIERVEAVR